MSRIDAHVGSRDTATQVDVDYELPLAAVTEAIVNAIAHLAGSIERIGTGTGDIIAKCKEAGLRTPEFI